MKKRNVLYGIGGFLVLCLGLFDIALVNSSSRKALSSLSFKAAETESVKV